MPSEKLISMIEENPELPLSTIKDTVTVTLKNADGSRETVVYEVTLKDGGNMDAILREHKVEN